MAVETRLELYDLLHRLRHEHTPAVLEVGEFTGLYGGKIMMCSAPEFLDWDPKFSMETRFTEPFSTLEEVKVLLEKVAKAHMGLHELGKTRPCLPEFKYFAVYRNHKSLYRRDSIWVPITLAGQMAREED